jgi:hypothetical protein
MDSDKAKVNKKWTSSDKYRDSYDKIFKKKENENAQPTAVPTPKKD